MPTVDELRDEIRVAVDRYERVESTAFTKEALAAVAEALGHDAGAGRLPPKEAMRAAILERVDAPEGADPDTPFRKAELEAVAAALDAGQ